MKIFITATERELAHTAFNQIADVLKVKPDATLGLATGSTPIPLYRAMILDHKTHGTSYKAVRTFNLDEYVGLPKYHPESYISFMTKNLFKGLDIDMNNVNIPNGLAEDIPAECARYSSLLANAEIDIQVLGIGGNGHIAFNEPGTPFDSTTHQVMLTEETIADNARFFSTIEEVPKSALTMGIGEIMKAKKILLLATGKNKANAICMMIKGAQNPDCPASALQSHPDVTVILDRDAAARL